MEWIETEIGRGGRVLVHCLAGRSRSAAVVVGWGMWKWGIGVGGAVERVGRGREVDLNLGFWGGLGVWEGRVRGGWMPGVSGEIGGVREEEREGEGEE